MTRSADDDEDNGDVSLSEVYNDDIEEDNSDWNEENEEGGEEGDDDIDSDEDAEEGAQQPKDGEDGAAAPAAAEGEIKKKNNSLTNWKVIKLLHAVFHGDNMKHSGSFREGNLTF